VLVQFRERPPFFRGWHVPAYRSSLLVAITAAVFMALAGPFGTWREPLAERLAFWVIGITGCVWFAIALDRHLRRIRWLRERAIIRSLAMVTLVAPLAALSASAAAAIIQRQSINWSLFWQTVPQIAMVGVGLVAVLLAGRRATSKALVAPDPTLGGLLPLKFSGANLWAIEAQDHYVRVHTDRGTALVLMSFEAALGEAAGLSGRRVHRSWWVARAAIVGVERGDGRAVLSLRGGPKAPVSRRYAKDLRSAGWY
jgi:hypothetical protein